ncbi:zinc-binding dehydrogenase [Halomicroarcula sp. S1AR25-4]|uniref:zinc-binding dehydrogenase n=1 Tax=Haloarcula sp. S1AR25-4 TaxID=2950538 RepID=UPI002873FE3F|nr:zinc-binding dehydrogenase [Halomicroarcula sp. S1AR25-4]MDS0278669.1 zinc-binding dehydrogenase [Halomicroarcula sp. S1AR25-4]
MNAIFYEETGSTDVLQYGEQPAPGIGSDEVLVEVKAAGLNHLDVWTRRGLPTPPSFPHIPGSDAAGVVREVGDRVTRFEAGDRVAVYPSVYCGECEFCRRGDETRCDEFKIIGEHTRGVHSELTAVAEANLVSLPEGVDWETAAATPLVFQTAWRMLETRAEVSQSDHVLVQGASGGVGHAAVQIAAHAGATVYATASSEEKLAYARDIGADYAINYEAADFVDAVHDRTDGRGVDVIIDHVGGDNWTDNMDAAVKGGRIVTCGATAGPTPETNISRIFWKQLDVMGSTMGNPGEIDQVLPLVWDGTFEPRIRAVLPMSEIARGHELLEEREGFGKVVVVPDAEYDG